MHRFVEAPTVSSQSEKDLFFEEKELPLAPPPVFEHTPAVQGVHGTLHACLDQFVSGVFKGHTKPI